MDQAAWAIAERIAAGARWIVIDGPSAAGKSELASRVAGLTRGVQVVEVDDFARPQSTHWQVERFREQVVAPLAAGRLARYQRWDWRTGETGDWVELLADQAVVLEGINAATELTGVRWDVRVWVDAPADTRADRARRRDATRFDCWNDVWRPIMDAWLAQDQPQRRADLVVENP